MAGIWKNDDGFAKVVKGIDPLNKLIDEIDWDQVRSIKLEKDVEGEISTEINMSDLWWSEHQDYLEDDEEERAQALFFFSRKNYTWYNGGVCAIACQHAPPFSQKLHLL